MLEGHYNDSNARLQRCITVGGRAYSPTSLFHSLQSCIIANAFPIISALSNSQSMGHKGSKDGSHQRGSNLLKKT